MRRALDVDGSPISPQRRHLLGQAVAATVAGAVPAWVWGTPVHAEPATKAPRPPVARLEPVTETFFGETVVDPYRWMENPRDKDWEPFMHGQDAYARATLASIPGRDALAKRIAELSEGTAVAYGAQRAGDLIFYEVRPAGADNFKLAVRTGAGGAALGTERMLIDPTVMKSEDGTHISLDWWVASPDGRHVVYGLSPAGSENSVLHVMEVATAKVLPERIPGTQYASPSWLPDSSGFFYWRLADVGLLGSVDYYKRSQARLHRLGTPSEGDPLLVQHGRDAALPIDEVDFPFLISADTGGWTVLALIGGVRRANPLFVARTSDVTEGRASWRQVCSVEDEVTSFAIDDDALYLLTTRNADNGKVLRLTLAEGSYASATTVVEEGERVIEGVALARDGLYMLELDGGYHALRKLQRTGGIVSIDLPFDGSVRGVSANTMYDGVWMNGSSWLLPMSTFRHEPGRQTRRVDLVPASRLDLTGYTATRTYATARDGTKVPLSIVAKKGLKRDGRNPALVNAYGAYMISYGPRFSPPTLALLERGAVFAVAHVRGGGEYGKRWWKDGQKLTKPNTWRDLIDCCEHLVKEGWTSPNRLTIQGGSAGGITVGRALTERPDLFAGVISNVGVSNALRMEFSQNGPPNIEEFGTVTERAGFLGLRAMDALHHVEDGTSYPAVLLTVGMTDPRVEAWNGGKMAARLQRATRSRNPILLRVSFDAGHGMGSTRRQVDEERADEFAFVLWRAGRRTVA